MMTKIKLPFLARFISYTITFALISCTTGVSAQPPDRLLSSKTDTTRERSTRQQRNPPENQSSPQPSRQGSSTATTQKELDFSGTGRPGRQTAGESRGECPPVNPNLTALIPTSNWGKTLSDRPTFWFYLPYSPQQIPVGEFVLQDENRNDIYRTSFTLTKSQGYASISIPQQEAPLEVGKWYRWYFKLYCKQQKISSPIFVQGWVQRVASDPTLEHQLNAAAPREDLVYATNQIWYDAVDHLAKKRLENPTSVELENDWNQLMSAKGVSLELPDSEPMVGSVELQPLQQSRVRY